MATYLDDLKYLSNNTQIWEQACKGALSKPLLPFGKAKDTFNIAQKCKAIQEKYGTQLPRKRTLVLQENPYRIRRQKPLRKRSKRLRYSYYECQTGA